jgi:hypothetical protein
MKECPNKCGNLTILERPVSVLHLLSEDLIDLGDLEGTETPEGMFGYIRIICSKCGFVGMNPPTHEYDYENAKWFMTKR